MSLQNMNNKDARLVLSSDAKPRLKWTPELHQRFVDAIAQLGGAEKATPKSLMRAMNIHGLTLYHLKSHLQKFRLGKSQQLQSYQDDKQEDYTESLSQLPADSCDEAQSQMNESVQIARALQMQMEVQKKLHEQIEVQRHLQLRIEAQGKYLQSVMRKAHETLAGYSSSSVGVEFAKAELCKLVSMVDMGCLSSNSISVLTEKEGSVTENNRHDSSLTSSESSGKANSVELSLMEMHPTHGNRSSGRKRSPSTISDDNSVGKPSDKMLRKYGLLEELDLNAKCLNEFDTGPKAIDLNCNGLE